MNLRTLGDMKKCTTDYIQRKEAMMIKKRKQQSHIQADKVAVWQ